MESLALGHKIQKRTGTLPHLVELFSEIRVVKSNISMTV